MLQLPAKWIHDNYEYGYNLDHHTVQHTECAVTADNVHVLAEPRCFLNIVFNELRQTFPSRTIAKYRPLSL